MVEHGNTEVKGNKIRSNRIHSLTDLFPVNIFPHLHNFVGCSGYPFPQLVRRLDRLRKGLRVGSIPFQHRSPLREAGAEDDDGDQTVFFFNVPTDGKK